MLQPTAPDPSLQLLAQLSSQLVDISRALGSPSTTASPTMPPNGSGIPWTAIFINITFFSSLILSLSVAIKGILLKQWLAHNRSSHDSDPRRRARIWYLRQKGWKQFHVNEMLADLPYIMEESVVLFLIGLTTLLWTLDTWTALCCMIFIVQIFAMIAWTLLAPSMDRLCPFKSPQSWMVYNIAAYLSLIPRDVNYFKFELRKMSLIDRMNRVLLGLQNFTPPQWHHYEVRVLRDTLAERRTTDYDADLLIAADASLTDNTFLDDVVRPCLHGLDSDSAVHAFVAIAGRRAESTLNKSLWKHAAMNEEMSLLAHIGIDLLSRMSKTDAGQIEVVHGLLQGLVDGRQVPSDVFARALEVYSDMSQLESMRGAVRHLLENTDVKDTGYSEIAGCMPKVLALKDGFALYLYYTIVLGYMPLGDNLSQPESHTVHTLLAGLTSVLTDRCAEVRWSEVESGMREAMAKDSGKLLSTLDVIKRRHPDVLDASQWEHLEEGRVHLLESQSSTGVLLGKC
ncbi:hypothetical protein CERSUDRAFT_124152 [Gelatoporia subvermispora B]|uniref:DUF6535 domain-containing protein n=1 Tax=Ceriporiopsis subvermispora (strain B) TaxID=914234 RepID=M2RFI0_CERS8|nr:hypothetical protein CERSUDRAFT_124152 [Gelatoporia subvermispora B]